MAKNFRIHEGADVHGWDNSVPLNKTAINSIKDPDGHTANKEITSIPSPFARMDLVNTAYEQVVEIGLDGDTIFHKMVSDALDVGQLFFNYDKYKDDLEIIDWNIKDDLNVLLESNNLKHRILGETYRLFIEQDAKQNNFDALSSIYLLNYKKEGLLILGATSPTTLFFTSANPLNLDVFQSGTDIFFDNEYTPLYKRDTDYIVYLFALRKSIPNFSTKFRTFDAYLEENFPNLTASQKDLINHLTESSIDDYEILNIQGGIDIEVLGYPLRKAPSMVEKIQKSDFLIKTSKEVESRPLILPASKFSKKFKYVSAEWPTGQQAPYYDTELLERRKLPFDNSIYPYLTISDLLDDYIVKTEFPINSKYFFTGNKKNHRYLLPIKPLFFEYFDVDFLNNIINGKKVVEFNYGGDADNMVEFILRVPIQNGDFIEYRRRYYTSTGPNFTTVVDRDNNKGAIIENRVNLVINPFYDFPEGIKPEYNIGIYDANYDTMFDGKTLELELYDKHGDEIIMASSKQRAYKDEVNFDLKTFIANSNIAYAYIDNGYTKSLLVPKMEKVNGKDEFIFAIDFGTTNTHIEYRVNGGIPQPLEIDADNVNMLGTLVENGYEVYTQNYIHDFFPRKLKKSLDLKENSLYNFPQKTSLTNHKGLDFSQTTGAYLTSSIPFKYGLESLTKYEEISTNLKWDIRDPNNEKKIKSFLEQILKMIRDKVALNNGDLIKTKVVWSYPVSMQTFILTKLSTAWDELLDTIFSPSIKRVSIPESLTPFYYFANVEGVTHHTHPMVSMDIGGKTTDIAIYQGKKPILFTSYKFAGDALFGDNYNRNININGYIHKYYDYLIEKLKNGADDTDDREKSNYYKKSIGVLKDIKSNQKSNDLIDAFFALRENVKLKDLDLDFEKYLANNDKLQVLIFIYFVANIYHLAQIFKSKGFESPKDIKFAGNGAKILNTLDSSKDKKILSKLATLIFNKVLGGDNKIQIALPELSKEISAKGGTYMFDSGIVDEFDIDDINYIHYGADMESEYRYSDKEKVIEETLIETEQFIDFLKDIYGEDKVKQSFNIDQASMKSAINAIRGNMKEQLYQGFDLNSGDVGLEENPKLSETLFFYPLVGSLGEIAYQLSNEN